MAESDRPQMTIKCGAKDAICMLDN